MESFADKVLSIARQALQSQVLGLELGWANFNVEQLTSHGVDASCLKLVDRLFNSLLEHAHKVRVDSHGFKQIDL